VRAYRNVCACVCLRIRPVLHACVRVCVRVCLRADVAAFLFHNAPLLEWIPLNSFWAVSDVFEEGGIRSLEFTNQYGMISINGACGIN
jgi:hypothetical protein